MKEGEILEIGGTEWKRILTEIGGFNFFQKEEWLNIVSKEFHLTNRYFRIKLKEGEAFICLQCNGKKAYSNFIGYGGPISNSNLDQFIIETFVNEIEAKFNIRIERIKLFPGKIISIKNTRWSTKTTSILEIRNDWESRISKNARNSVNNANKNLIYVRFITAAEFDQFYSLYEKTMERVKSSYKTSKPFFKKIFLLKNTYFIGAFKTKELIAVSVFLNNEKWSHYWWNASSQSGRKYNANYLIMFFAIKKLADNKFRFLDMASSNNNRILDFKRRWGAKDVEFSLFSNLRKD